MNSTNKINFLLSQHGFFSHQSMMEKWQSDVLSIKGKTLEIAQSAKQEQAKQLTNDKTGEAMQSLIQTCLQSENPLHLFKNS